VRREVRRRHDLKHLDVLRVPDLGVPDVRRLIDRSKCRHASSPADSMNVQFAVKDEEVYVLEVNPRASRTVPFVSKAIGRPLAKIAAHIRTQSDP
jgi:hypothetical protein